MNRNRIFWGIMLILAGGLLLMDRTNLFRFDVWSLFWPLAIVFFGGWLIVKNFLPGQNLENQEAQYPLNDIETAKITLKHGAGRLNLGTGSESHHLFEGEFLGGVVYEEQKTGTTLDLEMKPAVNVFDGSSVFPGNEGLKWNVRFNERVNYQFILKMGAGDHQLDFSQLNVSEITLDTGASATRIILPERSEYTSLNINAGAASVEVNVPSGVAAEILMKSGLSGTNVDLNRFVQIGQDHYRSRDYDLAEYKANVVISGGVGSFTVR